MSNLIPGEIIPEQGEIELNLGKEVKTVTVSNSGDRPVQVGSHYHFTRFYENLRRGADDPKIHESRSIYKCITLI